MKALNVFFIHNTLMREREMVMQQFRAILAKADFDKWGIKLCKVSNIDSFDPNNIDISIIQKTVNYTHFEEGSPFQKYNGLIKNLHIYQLSNSLKHLKALEVISSMDDDSLNLVLEDDVSYDPNTVISHLCEVIKQYTEGSVIFLGLPNNKQDARTMTLQPTTDLFELLPYNDSYILDKVAAKKLYESYLPIKFPNNIQLSVAIQRANVSSYQTVPNVFVDGSKLGIFTSSLTVNNVLMFNTDYMKLRTLATEKKELKPEDEQLANQLCEKSPCAPHPDFQYMKALYLTKAAKYNEALMAYEAAHTMYMKNMCILNHDSNFLKDYMCLYKHIQD